MDIAQPGGGMEVLAILQNIHFCYRWLVMDARARMYIYKVYCFMMCVHVLYMATFLSSSRLPDNLYAGWIYGSNAGLCVC